VPGNVATDRNLLFGILAVQMDFVSRDALITAMNAWVLAKTRPLGDLLMQQGALTSENHQLLEQMVAAHLKAHSGDVQRSLAAVAHHSTLMDVVQSLADPDLRASLTAAGATIATTAEERPPEDGLRYHILRPHAQGGLGVVSVARDAELGREVAFKEIQVRYAEDPNLRGRFVREAEITGGLEHPGIVPVYGLGRYADGRPYYAMRFIRGESLQEAIRKLHAGDAGYTLRGLLTRFVVACNAVAYAHSRGVIHRDLKPANVMLGPYGETLVADWGLAKVIGREPADGDGNGELTLHPPSGEGSLTQAGSALGTPTFMSPEQARGEIAELRPPTDVYSLGATLYAVLTGRPPVQGRDTAEVLEKVRQGDWQPPRQVKPSVQRPLDAVCRKAMALKTDNRYGTALELAADVELWLADEPVSAYREPWLTRAGRWVRRHRTKVAAGVAASFVALLLVGAGILWRQGEQARQLEEQERRRMGAEQALTRAEEFQAKSRWAEARAALDQAEDRLPPNGPEQLLQRLNANRRTLDLVTQLDAIRVQSDALFSSGPFMRRPEVDAEEELRVRDQDYEKALRNAGIGGPGDEPREVAKRLAASPLRDVLVAAFDDWSSVARTEERRSWILSVACQADPEPSRVKLRNAMVKGRRVAPILASEDVAPEWVTPALAVAAYRRGGVSDALLQQAVVARPGDFWLNMSLGSFAQARGKLAEAEAFFRSALSARPESAQLHLLLSGVLAKQHKLELAVAYGEAAIRLDPLSADNHNAVGWTLYRAGKPERAEALYRKASELNPELELAYIRLGRLKKDQGKLKESEGFYRQALRVHPNSSHALSALASVVTDQGRFDESEALCREAIRMLDRNPEAHNNLGITLAEQGKVELGIESFRKAISMSPNYAIAHANLSDALLKLGNAQGAVAAARMAIELSTTTSEDAWLRVTANVNLAEALLALEQFSDAQIAARRALEMLPRGTRFPEVEMTLRQAAVAERMPAVLRGDIQPANASECLDLAGLCRYQQRFGDAARLYRDAFAINPKLAEDFAAKHRYWAACSAARAGCGEGKAMSGIDDRQRKSWRHQALEWLRADFTLLSGRLSAGAPVSNSARLQIQHWFNNSELACVRDTTKQDMPEDERKEWSVLWVEARDVLAKSVAK
jgi:serine/threonine-protein kinase